MANMPAADVTAVTAAPAQDAVSLNAENPPWPPMRQAWYAVSIIALSLSLLQLDQGVIGFLVQPMKRDFGASDAEISAILGLAPVIFYLLVGLPMARLVDRYNRNMVLSAGVAFVGVFTAMCGVAQAYWQLFVCRMCVGTSQTVHGPGSFSMVADYFPPSKLPRAIGVIQIGYTVGVAAASAIGGLLVAWALKLSPTHLPGGIVIQNWQYVFIVAGLPGLTVAALIRSIPEPARRGLVAKQMPPVSQVFRELWKRRWVYGPLFLALALTSLESQGIIPWRVAFLQRTYGWEPARIGAWLGASTLVFPLCGIPFGAWLTETLVKRYPNGPVRALLINYVLVLPCAVAAPLMPRAEFAIILIGMSQMFATAGAIAQNTAIQLITPNQMRGQVTALFLFMFTVVGGLGANFLTFIEHLLGGEAHLGQAMAVAAGTMLPLAIIIMSFGVKPFQREVEAGRAAS